jgi:hypothetical protein
VGEKWSTPELAPALGATRDLPRPIATTAKSQPSVTTANLAMFAWNHYHRLNYVIFNYEAIDIAISL